MGVGGFAALSERRFHFWSHTRDPAGGIRGEEKSAFIFSSFGYMDFILKGLIQTYRNAISGDTVTYTATSGEGVEYWQYTHDLLNWLTEVSKNGTVVPDYEYSPDGLRQVERGSKGNVIRLCCKKSGNDVDSISAPT